VNGLVGMLNAVMGILLLSIALTTPGHRWQAAALSSACAVMAGHLFRQGSEAEE